MKIVDPIKGWIEFEPREYQKQLINKVINEDKDVIILSARQMGTSTVMMYIIRELCLNNPNYKALVVSTSPDVSKHRSQIFENNKKGVKRVTNYKVIFENGSEIFFYPGKILIAESLKNYDIFYDNYEFIPSKVFQKLGSYCEDCKQRFFSFTGNNDFRWRDSEVIKWNYALNPNFTVDGWKDYMIKLLGENGFKKEYEVE